MFAEFFLSSQPLKSLARLCFVLRSLIVVSVISIAAASLLFSGLLHETDTGFETAEILQYAVPATAWIQYANDMFSILLLSLIFFILGEVRKGNFFSSKIVFLINISGVVFILWGAGGIAELQFSQRALLEGVSQSMISAGISVGSFILQIESTHILKIIIGFGLFVMARIISLAKFIHEDNELVI